MQRAGNTNGTRNARYFLSASDSSSFHSYASLATRLHHLNSRDCIYKTASRNSDLTAGACRPLTWNFYSRCYRPSVIFVTIENGAFYVFVSRHFHRLSCARVFPWYKRMSSHCITYDACNDSEISESLKLTKEIKDEKTSICKFKWLLTTI